MNPIWQRLDALAGAAVNGVWGEDIRITPRTRASDYVGAQPDQNRPIREVRAVFAEETKSDDLRGQRLSGEGRGTTEIASSPSTLQIMAAEAAKIGFDLQKADLITLIQRPGQPSYSIVLADPLDCGDIVLILAREKVA